MTTTPDAFKTPEPGTSYFSQLRANDPEVERRCTEVEAYFKMILDTPEYRRERQVVDDLGPDATGVIVY